MITDKTPEQVAEELIRDKFPIAKYEKVQSRRKERLAFWSMRKIQPLIENEKKLVKFGEKVLELMKEAYRKN